MKSGLHLLVVCFAAISFSFGTAHAESYSEGSKPEEIEGNSIFSVENESTTNADGWFFNPDDGAKGIYMGEDEYSGEYRRRSDANEKPRYEWIFKDGSYDYYIDRKSCKWVRLPYSASEYMIDVWIRLAPRGSDSYVNEYDEDGHIVGTRRKYYLEHYYIYPKKQQIQFLCELEVAGRPQNTISEREYRVKNWENLIPGSIEDEIYRAVVKRMGKSRDSKGGKGFFEILDEYARISL